MLPGLAQLSAFRQFWAVTITPYGRDIEPRVPAKEVVMESFLLLVGEGGPEPYQLAL